MMGENDGGLGDDSSGAISLRRSPVGGEGVEDTLCVDEKLVSTAGILKVH